MLSFSNMDYSNKWEHQRIKKKFKNKSCRSKAGKIFNSTAKQIPNTKLRGWIRGKVSKIGKTTKDLNIQYMDLQKFQYKSVKSFAFETYGDHCDDYDEDWLEMYYKPWQKKQKQKKIHTAYQNYLKSSSPNPEIAFNENIIHYNKKASSPIPVYYNNVSPSPSPEPSPSPIAPPPPPPRRVRTQTTLYADIKHVKSEQEQKEYDTLSEQYISAMDDIETYGTYASIEGLSSRSTYSSHKDDKADVTSSNFKKIMKEIKKALPQNIYCSMNGSMFVRFDENNPRFLQALLTGLEDTPYANGCFLFDIYLCDDYPNKPLMIKHITKGAAKCTANNGPGGFSPNLHRSSGKVCLSLLGTWSGPGWEAGKSNVYQVISTVLFMIFGADHPYYMEPNHGGWEGTVQGRTEHERRVIDYDEEVMFHNAKYAILETLKAPYVGYEDVIKTHFKIKKGVILDTMQRWMECENYTDAFRERMKPVLEEIKKEFGKL